MLAHIANEMEHYADTLSTVQMASRIHRFITKKKNKVSYETLENTETKLIRVTAFQVNTFKDDVFQNLTLLSEILSLAEILSTLFYHDGFNQGYIYIYPWVSILIPEYRKMYVIMLSR